MNRTELERLFLSYTETDGRRVNVPKGTPGSISKPLQEPRDPLSMGISSEAVEKAKRKSLNPAEMDTVQFLLWAEEATLRELEEFSQRGGQEEDSPPLSIRS